jgi:hypothetical protein
MSAPAEKISLQDLYPPTGEERDSGERTMGGVLKGLDLNGSQRQPKKYRCRTYIPRAGEERDSDQRAMGWGQW